MTSVVRRAGTGEPSGFVRVLDLERGRVLTTARVPESAARAEDPNPRGGFRGAKGISALPDRLALANSDRVFVLDRRWELVGDLTHRWVGAIHDVLAEEDGVWVTSTNADLLLKLGWDEELLDRWCWRDDPDLVRALGFHSLPGFRDLDVRSPRALRGGVYNVGHLNALAPSDGGLLVSLGRVLPPRVVRRRRIGALAGRFSARPFRGALGDLPASEIPGSTFALVAIERREPRRPELVLAGGDVAVPNHNVWAGEGVVVYNDSNRDLLVAWDPEARRPRTQVEIPGSPGFVRGLVHAGEGRFLVGSQRPAAIHCADLDQGRVTASFELGDDQRESVYAICVVPSSFDDPPERLALSASTSR